MYRRIIALVGALVTLTMTACTEESQHQASEAGWNVETVTDGLTHPWALDWLPGGEILMTQRPGPMIIVEDGKVSKVDADLDDLYVQGEGGLMGMVISPQFSQDRRFFTCFATTDDDVKVVPWTLSDDRRSAQRQPALIEGLPLNSSGRHSGCRLRIGADGMLYVGTGDAAQGKNPQDLESLGGKVLRIDPATGQPPADNPFISSPSPLTRLIYSYGHRNVQGLANQPSTGTLFGVEHGPDVDDEINIIQAGGNYGWDPDGSGSYDESVPMTDTSIDGAVKEIWSTGDHTEALSGATFLSGQQWGDRDGRLVAVALKGQKAMLFGFDDDCAPGSCQVDVELIPELDGRYGRLRAAESAPNGDLYVTSSNGTDDVLLRITPA